MIEVFKCDFCTHFTQDAEEMRLHEVKYPINKTCFTCKHQWDSGYDYSIPEFEKIYQLWMVENKVIVSDGRMKHNGYR